MKFSVAKDGAKSIKCDLLVIGVFKSKANNANKPKKTKIKGPYLFEPCPTFKEFDKRLNGYLISEAASEGFKADDGQHFVTSTLGRLDAKSIGLLGLGDPHKQDIDLFRRAGGEAYKIAQQKQVRKLCYVIPEKTSVPLFDVLQAFVEGAGLSSYRFDRYQTKEKKENYVAEIEFLMPSGSTVEHALAFRHGRVIADAVCLARDLINEGPLELNPPKFAEHAKEVAVDGGLEIDILDEKRLKKEKFGLLLAVASAAQKVSPPRVIRLRYSPKVKAKQCITLIGKGVTFDSGGLDIKTAEGMLDMKIDMSGAAAVLATMSCVAKLAPKVEVVGYMACVENGVGPHAYHPGDILISRKGISVEVSNTDAEGRLVLADTITYSIDRDKPSIIIDVATLTGACTVALGLKTAGLFCNDDKLAEDIRIFGQAAGESYWRMPLNRDLKDSLKSSIADIKNCGDRYGGAITAALFLEEFIDQSTKWAHLDIAGPATNSKKHAYLTNGGVGFGVRTLINFLMNQA